MYSIQNDKLFFVIGKVEGWVGKPGPIIFFFKIKVNTGALLADLKREGSLPHLARTQQHYRWIMTQKVIQTSTEATKQHICISRAWLHFCIVMNLRR